MMRLAKYLALAGVASRRQAEELIKDGQIQVNGSVHTDLPRQIDELNDQVFFKGRAVKIEDKVYYLVNKPVGYISSRQQKGRSPLVTSLVPPQPAVYPVGRLDKDSGGLIILTNDGDLTYRLTHPKFEISKQYLVTVDKDLRVGDLEALKKGMRLEEGLAKVDSYKLINNRKVTVTIHQGWNRQLRRMFEKLEYRVISLTRIAEGPLQLGSLAPGKYRQLSLKEIEGRRD